MTTAHVLEPPKFDISTLHKRYDVKLYFTDALDARTYRARPEELYKWVVRWAKKHFLPDEDIFVLTGNQTMLAVFSAALMRAHPKKGIKFLRYDFPLDDYVEFTIGDTSERTSTPSVLPSEGTSPGGLPHTGQTEIGTH